MNWRVTYLILLLNVLLVVAGCAAYRYDVFPTPLTTAECDARFLWWQRNTEQAGTFDAQAWSPPGFPYLRVDRFLASYDFTDLSPVQRGEWLRRAHGLAIVAWQLEAEGQGPSVAGRIAGLRACGEQAIARLNADPGLWAQLGEAKSVPDSYSTTSRVIGLYPLVAPLVSWRASHAMGALMAEFGGDYGDEPWQYYRPEGESGASRYPDGSGPAWRGGALGIPDIPSGELQAMFRHYAPRYGIATRNDHDLPGRPGRDVSGRLHFLPEPVVYTQLAFTRWQGQVLPQLVYTIWFSARPAVGAMDIYAGALDGFVWRVTLGSDGLPLVYDFVHSCGCYHQWLPVDGRLTVRDDVEINREPFWLLDFVPVENTAPTLYLASGNHQLVRLAFNAGPMDASRYQLREYRSLRGRSYAGGRLFGADGFVAGSERPERYLLWPTGVVSAGGMRQWGHHAIAFVGRAHLDDPDLLERYFIPVGDAGSSQQQQ